MVVFQQQNLESWMGRLVLSRWFICKVNKGWFTYILCCNRLSNLRNAETDVSALLPTRDPPLVSETDFLHWRM
ncbi:hypothetical protein Pfo_014733 [Paulownia fortunei]|nr:hypothetical protein Pfo_014733 [Paulownia fortunei]